METSPAKSRCLPALMTDLTRTACSRPSPQANGELHPVLGRPLLPSSEAAKLGAGEMQTDQNWFVLVPRT